MYVLNIFKIGDHLVNLVHDKFSIMMLTDNQVLRISPVKLCIYIHTLNKTIKATLLFVHTQKTH